MTPDDDIRGLVLAVLAEVRACRAECSGVPAADDVPIAEFVAATFAAVQDRAWTARELVDGIALPADAAERLQAAVEALTGPLDAGSARRLGKALRRAAWREFGGLRIEPIGETRDGLAWLVRDVAVRVSPEQTRTLSRRPTTGTGDFS